MAMTTSDQIHQARMSRLGYYLMIYLVPGLLALIQPSHWQGLLVGIALMPGLWRAQRRRARSQTVSVLDTIFFSATSISLSSVVAATTWVLGGTCLVCWILVALEQAHRRESRRTMALIAQ